MPRSIPVREVMTADVVTFSPDQPVQEALERLVERDVDGGPVVDGSGRVIGMLSASDLLVQESKLHYPTVISLFGAYLELPSSHRHFEEDLRKAVGAIVGEVMHVDPVTCPLDATLEDAATLMHEHEVSRIPVLSDGKLVGIVARGDVLRAMVKRNAE